MLFVYGDLNPDVDKMQSNKQMARKWTELLNCTLQTTINILYDKMS